MCRCTAQAVPDTAVHGAAITTALLLPCMHQDSLQQKSIAQSAALEVLTYRMAERQACGSEKMKHGRFVVSIRLTSVSSAQLLEGVKLWHGLYSSQSLSLVGTLISTELCEKQALVYT